MTATLQPKDFASDQEVRWCPGCGDYAILKAIQKVLAAVRARPENTVFVSGIGCSSRFPYYVSTYGFHTIHGRAPAIATGLKLANPDLDVWVITGDGDGLSIGGNHMLHVLRRNVDLQIILFNNEIYGLTKGQYSPTSRRGTRTPSTPQGSVDSPLLPASFALGAGARFVARAVDAQATQLVDVLKRAHEHRGASFVEIFQNCVVYNDGVFSGFTDRAVAAEHQLHLEHGKPMIFGKAHDKGVRVRPGTLELEVVNLGEHITVTDLLVHDERDRTVADMLVRRHPPDFPVALGVIYCDPAPTYDRDALAQVKTDGLVGADINAVLRRGRTWTIAA
jgi:2-oxoglutarate ferredoxin oxidoreductase subunit beta